MRLFAVAVRPRHTMRRILGEGTSHVVLVALVVGALVSSVLRDFDSRALDRVLSQLGASALLIAIVVTVVSTVCTVLLFYLFSWIATIVGRHMGGEGDVPGVRAAIAWGLAPLILAIFYRLPAVLFWPTAASAAGGGGEDLVKVDGGNISVSGPALDAPSYQVAILGILHIAALIWYLAVASQTLGEAHNFSTLRGLANLIVAVVLPIVAIAVVMVAGFLAWT